jgi:3D (Asp-Asp-Asp) domain-containing protein
VTAYVVGRKKGGGRNICISASGENVCEALKRGQKRCAANFAALGSLLHIEGHGTYLVTDRLHRRYRHRVDIAMGGDKYQQAIQFGLKRLHVTELAPAEDKPKEVVSRRGQTPLAKSSKKKGQKRRLG